MARYSKEFKDSTIAKMMPPQNKAISKLAKETGIPEVTLYKWRKKARESGFAVPGGQTNTERWSTQDKFHIVLETATLSEVELAKYCREKGLYVEQVQAWKDACLQANGGVAQESAKLQKELKQKEKEYRKLQKELNIKEKALAETAALLVLRKKAHAIWGGRRGRLISAPDRKKAIQLIQEAVQAGAREKKACTEIGISKRTLERWLEADTLQDQRQVVKRPVPKNKLTEEERNQILEIVNQKRFQSLPPSQIVPALADEGVYIASESSFYRVLREHKQQNHRGYSITPSCKLLATHLATGPNQVWMWDITWCMPR